MGPPIQVVGVALTTEFCDHNISYYKSCILVLVQRKTDSYTMRIVRMHSYLRATIYLQVQNLAIITMPMAGTIILADL